MGAWRLEVVVPLMALWLGCVGGAARLARRSPAGAGAGILLRLLAAWGAVVTLATALLGLDGPAHERFSAHMLQHVLLIAGAPPLLLLADPFPFALWALPSGARARVGRTLAAGAPGARAWRALTRPALGWPLHVGVLWAWHAPPCYDLALAHPLAHDAQHLSLFLTSVLFWWAVIAPAPRPSPRVGDGARIACLVLAAFAHAALGLGLMLAPTPLYAYRGLDAARALDDQALGGLLMWGAGGLVDLAAVLLVLARTLSAASLTPPARQARMKRLDA
jgi:cytochrome c oxidase assembly factor CtaG